MKRIIATFFALALLLPVTVAAQMPNAEERVVLSSNETVDDDYFAAGSTVEVSGTVNGDAYIAGGQIIVDGTINGDLLVAGGSILISGTITEDVRVVGGNITITGEIGDNLSFAGGNVTITEDAQIAGNLAVAGGNVDLLAPVAGSVRAGVGNLNIANSVGGDVEAGVGNLRLSSAAAVGGSVTYWSETEASIAPEASVSGEVQRNEVKRPDVDQNEVRALTTGFDMFTTALSLITTLILGFILLYLFPRFNEAVVKVIDDRPPFALLIGLLAMLLIPMIAIAMMITVIGIPLGILTFTLYFVLLYLSRIYAMSWIGSKVLKNSTPITTFMVGLVIYYLVGIVPIVGPLLKLLATLIGLGGVLLAWNASRVTTASRKK